MNAPAKLPRPPRRSFPIRKLAKDESVIGQDLRRFLAHAYKMKAVADYETGPGSEVPPERAMAATETAQKFVDCIWDLLNSSASP
jgi:hypothetical protein